jgi:hypothetical protein
VDTRYEWSVQEIYELSTVIVGRGADFVVRRTLRRLEKGEIKIRDAIWTIRAGAPTVRGPDAASGATE